MSESKYIQLKKREAWLGVLIAYCDGSSISSSSLEDSIKQAKHFYADLVSKIVRYEVSHGIN